MRVAFRGVDKLLLLSTGSPERAVQRIAVIEAAQKAGVHQILYTGVAINDVHTAATRFIMESHFQTEDAIRQSGLTYTFLRHSLYTDMIAMYIGNDFVKSILPAFAQDIKQQQYEIVTDDLSTLLGRKPAALQEALTEIDGFKSFARVVGQSVRF